MIEVKQEEENEKFRFKHLLMISISEVILSNNLLN